MSKYCPHCHNETDWDAKAEFWSTVISRIGLWSSVLLILVFLFFFSS